MSTLKNGVNIIIYWVNLSFIRFNKVLGFLISFMFESGFKCNVHMSSIYPGGGTQIWFGRECAADAAKPLPVFRGHFG